VALTLSAIPPAPRVPSARARELIFRYQGTQKALLIVGLVFFGIGGALSIPFCWGVPSDIAIAAGGRAQHGRVISAQLDRSTKINGRNPTLVRFAYSVDDKRYQAESSTLDGAVIAQAREGESIPIQVSAMNPQWARITGSTRSIFGYGGLMVLFFPLLGLLLAGFAVRSNRREIRAFVHGEAASAKVVYAGPDRTTTINGRHPWKVDWEFRSGADGKIYAGSLSSMTALALEDFSKAEEIVILYDPADPSVSTAWVD